MENSRAPNERAIKAQLDRILASRFFSKSDRLSGFLSFVVEQSIRGAGDSLKESVLARELYNKGLDFDTAADPIVRIDARRLRDKLREYYSEFGSDPVLVSVPKGAYAAVFEWNPDAPGPVEAPMSLRVDPEPQPARSIYPRPGILAAASVCLIALIGTSGWLISRDPSVDPAMAVPLTTYAGSEGPPSLSPDGQFVAFDWTGTTQPPVPHIYIKEARGEALRQLTGGPASERNAAWSPDGSHIAFIRGGQGVFVVSPLGGHEQKVSDTGTHVGWASDSKSVLIRDIPGLVDRPKPFGIYQVSLESGKRRHITQAPAGIGDWVFSVSPDGKTLAFARYGLPGIGDVFVVPMSGGEPRRITDCATSGISVAWTADGSEIVYSQEGRLWRIPWNVSKPGRGKPVAGQTGDANFLSISRPGASRPARLAYQVENLDVGLRLVDLSAVADGSFTSVQPLADSTRMETHARFSRDASKVAFASNRSGPKEIWVCNRDGGDLRQLTSLGAPNTVPYGWSPDERTFLIQATVNGNTDIYVMPASGGQLKQLTRDPFLNSAPSWSRDGKWIYFASNRSAASDHIPAQLWRMPAQGGEAVQITRSGGFAQQESFDGKFLYFLDRPHGIVGISDIGTLMRMPVEGGAPTKVLEGVRGMLWTVTPKGIFFMTRDSRADSINRYKFEDSKAAPIARLPFRVSKYNGGLTVSEDGRWLITTQTNRDDTDLMLIENFR